MLITIPRRPVSSTSLIWQMSIRSTGSAGVSEVAPASNIGNRNSALSPFHRASLQSGVRLITLYGRMGCLNRFKGTRDVLFKIASILAHQ